MSETVTITIESDADDETEELEVPAAAADILTDDETATKMAGDLVILGLAQQLHASVFHTEETPADRVKEANEALDATFEERFGMTFEEMAGHEH